ncbi:DUF1287 domain-containing protein [Pseudomonas berkeleyensis]|uniref:DUF1287 domain-containing protein n=1 Tax=Pseudomonas berkeleyensis TaxID=2726956 RepID=A0A7G5DVS9_9PSED|nr:DUF1287 domain-containing protein [Pseudomonas berkeleyensis]QMV65854.1 DUF1287 domain-containing protein [Pseudomonas berkeleyensis]WSO41339.1 DUF1287 domain-containing protein [Pseudomonas berkeleyensis]
MRMVIALLVWSLAFAAQAIEADKLVLDARKQVGVTLSYDPAYRKLSYPGGDVPMATGVCTDVVIRALRQQGLDLQESVHRDMRGNFAVYPKHWGLSRPDSNIDHRRVPNLMTWFKRQGWSLPVKQDASAYRAGDIVTWDLGRGLTHIGIVSDRQAATGTPLVLHNIGRGTQEEDILFAYRITGHYRALAQQARAGQ